MDLHEAETTVNWLHTHEHRLHDAADVSTDGDYRRDANTVKGQWLAELCTRKSVGRTHPESSTTAARA